MESKLNPSLFGDLLDFVGVPRNMTDMRHLAIPANLTVMLALSSKKMFEALSDRIKNKCNYVTDSPFNDMLIVYEGPDSTGHSIEFTDTCHIKALLKVVGENIRNIRQRVPSGAWMEPFVDGLSNNKALQLIHENAGEAMFTAFLRGNNKFPEIEAPEFLNKPWAPSMLSLVQRHPIHKLSIDPTGFLRRNQLSLIHDIDVEKLHIASTGFLITHNIFKDYKPKMHVLKHLHCSFEVYTDIICEILTQYTEMESILFRRGVIPSPVYGTPLELTLRKLKQTVKLLWHVIMKYPGQHVDICARQYVFVKMPLPDLRKTCKKYLRGYKYYKMRGAVLCTYRKVAGNKSLTIQVDYYNQY